MTTRTTNGIDLSHWNTINAAQMMNYDFVILKATQGTDLNYNDPTYNGRITLLRGSNKTCGSYHYGMGGDAQKEAFHYIGAANPRAGESTALDIEGKLETRLDVIPWCYTFASQVEALHGEWPYMYMNKDTLQSHNWTPLVKLGCPLWLASYDGTKPSGDWPYVSRWQHTDTPYDLNIEYQEETVSTTPPKQGPATTPYRNAYQPPTDVNLTDTQWKQEMYNYLTMIARDAADIKKKLGA